MDRMPSRMKNEIALLAVQGSLLENAGPPAQIECAVRYLERARRHCFLSTIDKVVERSIWGITFVPNLRFKKTKGMGMERIEN